MTLFLLLPFAAGVFSLVLALLSLLRARRSPAVWFFFAGMAALGIDSLLTWLSLRVTQSGEVVHRLTLSYTVKCAIPAIWLGFSLSYSRGNYREALARWRIPIAVLGLLPVVASLAFAARLFDAVPIETSDGMWRLQFDAIARPLNVVLLVGLVLVLMNLEQTFRSAVGTMRWQIKFVVLAMALIVGARLYVRSQAILFSAPDIAFWGIESGALLIGCLFLVLAYARSGWAEIDVYPSIAVVRSSLTVLIVGGYLFVVGVLAQVVRRFGGEEIFQFQSFIVLLGLTGLAVLLLSDRVRQRTHIFIGRHFRRGQHDSTQIWTMFSRRLARVKDSDALCAASAKLISETFDVLSVTIWLLDEQSGRLVISASSSRSAQATTNERDAASGAVAVAVGSRVSPFDLDEVNEPWAEEFRQLNSTAFTSGGNRLCIPLRAGDEPQGAIVLADRVNGAVYTVEELELLKCIGDQMTSVLLGLRLAGEVARARELEAFRTMSTFFVHDLKNAAASLNLMLKNLPVHFDDPAFREDALRAVGNTARRIDDIIARLSAVRKQPSLTLVQADLNQLVTEALETVNGAPNVEVTRELEPVPMILADREQIRSVVTNLVLNAREAVTGVGHVHVRTAKQGERVVLSIADDGCGMSQTFVNESLFRPFQSTKKSGLGIGLFQSQAIVRAHGGGIQVTSEVGKGTTFLVSLPATGAR